MGLINIDGYTPAHLSFSTIAAYRSCGKRFWLEKIAKVEQRPGLAALGGNALHTASERIDLMIFEQGFACLDVEHNNTNTQGE